jgi:nucleoside-diphosphate-sugar epimerase
MRVLVSGAAGYLGTQVVGELLARNVNVVAAARSPVLDYPDVPSVTMDLRFPFDTFKTLERNRPDGVIALAYTRTDAARKNPQLAMETNVTGTNALFDACATLGIPVVVYSSSINVYGLQSDFGNVSITEDMHGRPRTLYGWTKQLNEALAEHYNASSGTRFVGIRYSGIHGQGKPSGFNPFDRIVDAASIPTSVTLPWSASLEISFLHVRDAARMAADLVMAGTTSSSIYNSGGEVLTLGKIGATATELSGATVQYTEPGEEILAVSRVDNSRLTTEFAFRLGTAKEWFVRDLALLGSRRMGRRVAGSRAIQG